MVSLEPMLWVWGQAAGRSMDRDENLTEMLSIVGEAFDSVEHDVHLEIRDHRLWMRVGEFVVGHWRWSSPNYICECFKGELFVAKSLDLASARAIAAISQQLSTSTDLGVSSI
jgi:hypothetical protein